MRPEDVFTPATPVQDDMFATRHHEHLQDRVEDALGEPGRQVVVYGVPHERRVQTRMRASDRRATLSGMTAMMKTRVLVTAATRHGSTMEIAEAIGRTFGEQGFPVTVEAVDSPSSRAPKASSTRSSTSSPKSPRNALPVSLPVSR